MYDMILNKCQYYFPPHTWVHTHIFPSLKPLTPTEDILPYSFIFADLTFYCQLIELLDIKVPFYLITGDNVFSVPLIDCKVPKPQGMQLLEHPYLIKWFSINVSFPHSKLIPLPLGCSRNIPLKQETHDTYYVGHKVDDIKTFFSIHYPNLLQNFLLEKKSLVYVQFDLTTDQDALHPFSKKRKEIMKYVETIFPIQTQRYFWTDYMLKLKEYQFIICPPGKGIDTFRCWDALCAGVIPIVWDSSISSLYQDLPVVILQDEKQLSVSFLEKEYTRILSGLKNNIYSLNKLTSEYWIQRITENS